MWFANTIFGDVIYVDAVGSDQPVPGIPAQRRETRTLRCGCNANLVLATWDGKAITDIAAQAEAEAEAHAAAHVAGVLPAARPPAGPETRSEFTRRIRAEYFGPVLDESLTSWFWLRAERGEATTHDVGYAIDEAALEAADRIHFDWRKARDVREATRRRLTREARDLGIAV